MIREDYSDHSRDDPDRTIAPDQRFPRRLFRSGSEPDPRFTLANERTFLAWIRTGIALLAAGVALEALGLDLRADLRLAASLILIGAGVLAPIQAWSGWYRTERALRLGRPLPSALSSIPTAVAAFVAGVLVGLALLLR